MPSARTQRLPAATLPQHDRVTYVAGDVTAATRGCVVLPVSNPARAAGLATFAAAVAAAEGVAVLALHVVANAANAEVPSAAGPDLSRWPALQKATEVARDAGAPVYWALLRCDDVGLAVRFVAEALAACMVVLGWRGAPASAGGYLDATLVDVLTDPVCAVAVVGGEAPRQVRRLLVALGSGAHSRLALDLAASLTRSAGEAVGATHRGLTVVHVVHSSGRLARWRGSLHLRGYMRRCRGLDYAEGKVLASTDVPATLLGELGGGYDALVMGTSREALIDRMFFGDLPQRVAERSQTSVIVVRQRTPRLARVVRRFWYLVTQRLPQMSVEERDAVHGVVLAGSQLRLDFITMTALAALLATLGLLLNSPAVIIGAMLVAPMMSAMLGLGLAVVEGDGGMLAAVVRTAVCGTLIAIALGFVVVRLVPGAAATAEVMSRTSPSLLDLGVALASGTAGAYALCRKNVSASMVGVAVAAALVPPLATVGVGLGLGSWRVAFGAFLLYLTNLVAIVATSGVVFLLLGFAPSAGLKQRRSLLRQGLQGFFALLALLTAILTALTAQSVRQSRFNRAVWDVARAAVAGYPWTELDDVTYEADANGALLVSLTVRSGSALQPEDALDVQEAMAARLHRNVAVSLNVIAVTRLEPVVLPAATPTSAEAG